MAKKVLYTDFTDTETLIASVLNSPEIKKAMKRKNLFDMWEKSVGTTFAQKSKPFSMRGRTIVIACENSAVVQELMLRKLQILQKLTPLLKALNMTVNDIKFETKSWTDED
ncbi:DUF721 domain-containing protein [bacterium]|nr:DUF721 domain-containing protein [bacterium]